MPHAAPLRVIPAQAEIQGSPQRVAGWWRFFAGKCVAGACHKRWGCVLIDGYIFMCLAESQAFPDNIKWFR